MNYDIIGDIHGQADKLHALLQKLDYAQHNGVYQQANRVAIFVGDFIDRGLQQKEVINIVRPMIDAGKALAVMGNHEFNAICYHSSSPTNPDQYLRKHSENNIKQHQNFLNEYPHGNSETNELITWFKTLPLFLEIESEFRVIHACWDDEIIDLLKDKNYINQNNCLKPELYPQASEKGHELYQAIETLLKGKELALPEGLSFMDNDGNKRHEIRIKWWLNNANSFQQAAVHKIDALTRQAEIKITENTYWPGYSETNKPVFFGHYWFTGDTFPLAKNVVCLDYSAAAKGPLVSYSWDHPHDLQGKYFTQSTTDKVNSIDSPDFSVEDIKQAYQSTSNIDSFKQSELCGCFYCLSTFKKEEVTEFNQGIWCPRCGIDSVLSSGSGYSINRTFLAAMKQYYF